MQAVLIDPDGKVVAEMPYQRISAVLNAKREKAASDEVWQLKFVKIEEDMRFQVGLDGIPLVSIDPDGVIGRTSP